MCAENENCTGPSESPVDRLVVEWGYKDLMPENLAEFDQVPYHVHLFMGILLTVICKKIYYKLTITCASF